MSTAASAALTGPALTELPIVETSLSRALRLRLSLVGLGIGLLALAAAAALGVWLAAAVFHTAPGALA